MLKCQQLLAFLTFICRINNQLIVLKQEKSLSFNIFISLFKFHAQLSKAWEAFLNLEARMVILSAVDLHVMSADSIVRQNCHFLNVQNRLS